MRDYVSTFGGDCHGADVVFLPQFAGCWASVVSLARQQRRER